MVVSIKDALKLIGVSIISCCAVLVCTMFINYNMDIVGIKGAIDSAPAMAMYEAQVMTSKVTVLVTGGCLLVTSIITLLFYIKHFIDVHKKDLGILKALGYSDIKIALNFWVFGLSVLVGTAIGFALAFAIMPKFYRLQNNTGLLPDMAVHFHAELLVCLVVLPSVVLAVISVLYLCLKLKQPVIMLLKDTLQDYKSKKGIEKEARNNNASNTSTCDSKVGKKADRPFLKELMFSGLKTKKTLVFFMWFASFCFSAMTQMSISMKDLSSTMMAVMMMTIGLTLACTTLLLAITTVIKGNSKAIATMRAIGYSQIQCSNAVLGGYRPFAYVGFAIGTVYQYGLLKLMVTLVFKNVSDMPEYKFGWQAMLISLAVFAVLYEVIMLCCAERIKKIPIKQIMLE